jgi:hypothetical protein
MGLFIADLLSSLIGFIILFLRYWNYQKMKNHLSENDYNSFSEFTKYNILRIFGIALLVLISVGILISFNAILRHELHLFSS